VWGAVREQASAETLRFRCRIGHELSLGEMLAEHGVRRRTQLVTAVRQLTGTAELNRRVAEWARARGHLPAAARLEQEALVLDEQAAAVLRLATSALLPAPGRPSLAAPRPGPGQRGGSGAPPSGQAP
jgi:two-component system chemotaxis response regulator CheB